jgi:hypothetical protein
LLDKRFCYPNYLQFARFSTVAMVVVVMVMVRHVYTFFR